MFNQSFREFLNSKTNFVATVSVVLTFIGFFVGHYDYGGLQTGIIGSLGMITLRDTMMRRNKDV